MHRLPPDQKRYLLEQNQASRAGTMSRSAASRASKTASTYGPASAAGMLPRLVPQLTGDSGIMRRFSIAGWGAAVASSSDLSSSPRTSVDLSANRRDSIVSLKASPEKTVEPSALQPQATGGLWSSWWASSGGSNGAQAKETEKTPSWYAAGIRNGRTSDTKLVKHLISLRVHLSTANLAWIEDFVSTESGMNVLGDLLTRLVSKGGKRKKLSEAEDTVLLEVIKCLRALLNTEVIPLVVNILLMLTVYLAWIPRSSCTPNPHHTPRLFITRLASKTAHSYIGGACGNLCPLSERGSQGSSLCHVRLPDRVRRSFPFSGPHRFHALTRHDGRRRDCQ